MFVGFRVFVVVAAFVAVSAQAASLPDTIGVYRPSTGQWLLRNTNTTGAPNITVTFGGEPGDLPVVGDWNGDGRTDIGIFNNGTWTLAQLITIKICTLACITKTLVDPIAHIGFGEAGDLPVAGDWDGDGKSELGVFHVDPVLQTGVFILRVPGIILVQPCSFCPFVPVPGFVPESHNFGGPGNLPVAGDWDGDGRDSFGVLVPGAPGLMILTNDFVKPQIIFTYGKPGDQPLAGKWTGDDFDLVGLFRDRQEAMLLSTVLGNSPDLIFDFGAPGDKPVAGHWAPVP